MRNLSNYLIGFGISGLIHTAVIVFVVLIAFSEDFDKQLVTVDFSSLNFANIAEASAEPRAEQTEIQPPEPNIETASEPEEPEAQKTEEAEPEPAPVEEAAPTKSEKRVEKEIKKPKKPKTVKKTPSKSVQSNPGNAGTSDGSDKSEQPTQGSTEQSFSGYSKTDFNYILIKIRRKIVYPEYARQKRIEGRVKVQFTVKRDGTISDLKIFQSSGSGLLDDAALLAVRKAAPLPKPPVAAKIVIPISFRISDNK